MSKKSKHWCDPEHQKKESKFDTGVLAEQLVNKLTDWVINDFTISKGMNVYQQYLQRDRMQKILECAEEIEATIKAANSIYAIYPIDFQQRRKGWLIARSNCFKLITYLTHIVNYVEPNTNVQKYINLSIEINTIAAKIKKIMITDDETRKTKAKEY